MVSFSENEIRERVDVHARAEAAVDVARRRVDALKLHARSRAADAGDGGVVEDVELGLVLRPECVSVELAREFDRVTEHTL